MSNMSYGKIRPERGRDGVTDNPDFKAYAGEVNASASLYIPLVKRSIEAEAARAQAAARRAALYAVPEQPVAPAPVAAPVQERPTPQVAPESNPTEQSEPVRPNLELVETGIDPTTGKLDVNVMRKRVDSVHEESPNKNAMDYPIDILNNRDTNYEAAA